MEMATIEEVKAGMNSVLDGMLGECFNRSDGLSELMGKLQLVRSVASDILTNIELTLMRRKLQARRRRTLRRIRELISRRPSKTLSTAASEL